MTRLSDGEIRSTADHLAGLDRMGLRPVDTAAREINGALDRAAGDGTPSDEAASLDERVVCALAQAREVDAILERVEPTRLADLVDRCARRLGPGAAAPDASVRRTGWAVLDLVRRPALLRRIPREQVDGWAASLLALVEASHYTVGPLFRRRAEQYGSKTLFELPGHGPAATWSWRRAAARVEYYSRVLLALDDGEQPAPIAFLSDNRIEAALLDLACLSSGLVNVMVPANASESDVVYSLRHSHAGTLIVSGEEQLRKVLRNRESLPELERIVTIDRPTTTEQGVVALDALGPAAEAVPRTLARERSEAVCIDDLATIMYTSGTTGTPKGIQFTHRNIVYKRFARALALPEIGPDDVFLCFLPLYHTFGRFLELLGCVFWGATYCFLENTSFDGLGQGMRRYRPTVFISVPKKWMQLYEMIAQKADPERAVDRELAAATRWVTGGRLRWGLSAAGYLDPEIFRFFHRHGIELLSGFGMTEATGGITMTRPGVYEDGSLGTALPGIELRLEDDGELLVRGPYVMAGYLDPPEGETTLDGQGWLRTGDLMEDDGGQLRLVDRKKEIYKNIKGETIAPQRVENMFRDFESVGRTFLVGDHRDYNTLLLYPNPDFKEFDLRALSEQEIHDHLRSLVVSVNRFLAPHERIVDFAIIPRDLDAERGELTDKGTPRRKVIEKNFAEIVRKLYRRANLHVGDVDLVIPNWLFQILGLTARDIRCEMDAIMLPSGGTRLTVRSRGEGLTQVGSCLYRHPDGPLNLGALLTAPRLWLGNEELVSFVPLDMVTRQRTGRQQRKIDWAGRAAPYRPGANDHQALESLIGSAEPDLLDLDLAARMLASPGEMDTLLAVSVLEDLLRHEEGPLAEPVRMLLNRLAAAAPAAVRRRAFQLIVPAEKEGRFAKVIKRFLARDPELLDVETRETLAGETLSEARIEAFIDIARRACALAPELAEPARTAQGLLAFLAAYGADHPVSYKRIRAFLKRMSLDAEVEELRDYAEEAALELQEGFRRWLGPSSRVAVDPEAGNEYGWEEAVEFAGEVPDADRKRLMSALKQTPLLKEAVFLFSTGVVIGLGDIPQRGVRIRLLGSRHGKSVYRLTVQTRHRGVFDLAVNLNHDMTPEQVSEETHWLILSGDPGNRRGPLVEDFGGYWRNQDLWSEEFIAGETLDRAMQRLSRLPEHESRLGRVWPFMAWATLAAWVDFWHRSGKRLEIADPSMSNIVVPTRDFLSGVRIVSLSRRRLHSGLLKMLRAFRDEFVCAAEERLPIVRGIVGWRVIFSSVLEVVGEIEGLSLFRQALDEVAAGEDEELCNALRLYRDEVATRGFVPLRLFFAVERYRRWTQLSGEATPQARARMLQELFDTYGLQRLAALYPEIRVRFFAKTAFEGCSPALAEGLKEIIRSIRDGKLAVEELIDAVDELRPKHELRPDDDYFLARLSYPHLRPQDAAGFVRTDLGGRHQSDIVVKLDDKDGTPYRIRHALNPREVERLFRLFLAAKLDVRFGMQHQYLVAINERGHIIGGIYYEVDESGDSAHLEKIVVAERHRGKRVSDGLMHEFAARLRASGVKILTTGFFRAQYFYGHGFKVSKHHAGLVKSLAGSESGWGQDTH